MTTMCYIISIEGNIGSGKSTLVKMLKNTYSNDSNIVFLEEPVDIWQTIKDKNDETILTKFYRDQSKYAFPFQMMAYISRISMLKEAVKENPGKTIICERCVMTDKNVFAKMLYDAGNIEEVNYQIYLKWFDEFIDEIPISGIVYVKAEPEVSYSRVIKRNREGESIPLEYLKQCHQYHEDWLTHSENDVLILDANKDKDFDKKDYESWLYVIKSFLDLETSTKKKQNYIYKHMDEETFMNLLRIGL